MKKNLNVCSFAGIGSEIVIIGSNVTETRGHLEQLTVDLN